MTELRTGDIVRLRGREGEGLFTLADRPDNDPLPHVSRAWRAVQLRGRYWRSIQVGPGQIEFVARPRDFMISERLAYNHAYDRRAEIVSVDGENIRIRFAKPRRRGRFVTEPPFVGEQVLESTVPRWALIGENISTFSRAQEN